MDTALIEAFWHAEHRLLGRRLKPLTLRHCFVLATAGNPLITGERIPELTDIAQAVEICSRDAEFFLSGKKPSWAARQITGMLAWAEKRPLEKFRAYLDDYCSGPEVWSREGGKGAKAHFTISIVAGLGHWLGVPLRDAWQMSPGEANWMLAAAIEQSPHGSIEIVGDGEEDAIRKALEGNDEERSAA